MFSHSVLRGRNRIFIYYLNEFHATKGQTEVWSINSLQTFLSFFIQEAKQRMFHLRVRYAAFAATACNVILQMVVLQVIISKAGVVLSE